MDSIAVNFGTLQSVKKISLLILFAGIVIANANYVSAQCQSGVTFPFSLAEDSYKVPYPNDLFTIANSQTVTGRQLDVGAQVPIFKWSLKLPRFFRDDFNLLDGFGTLSDGFIQIPNPISEESLPLTEPELTDSILMMVADSEHPKFGQLASLKVTSENGFLKVTPWRPLLENTRYIYVVTDKLKTKKERCFEPSSELSAIINDDNGTYKEGLSVLTQHGIESERLLAIAEFTTLSASNGLRAVESYMDQQTNPSIENLTYEKFIPPEQGEEDEPLSKEALKPDVQGYLRGSLDSPVFNERFGSWEANSLEEIQPLRNEELSVLISLPKDVSEQPFPVMIYGHGSSQSHEDIYGRSQWFAENGYAGIAVDAQCHGDRENFIPISFLELFCYYDFLNPLAWRDNGRDSIVSYMWLRRAIASLAEIDVVPEGGDGIPDFDVESIYYLGISLGAIHGGGFAAIDQEIEGWVLAVGGAKYTDIAFENEIVRFLLKIVSGVDALFNSEFASLIYPVGSMYQTMLDASDPGTLLYNARELYGQSPQVIQIGAAFDNTVSGASGANMVRAGGWPQISDYTVYSTGAELVDLPYAGSAFLQYDTKDHGILTSGEFEESPGIRWQVMNYLKTIQETGVGLISPVPEELLPEEPDE